MAKWQIIKKQKKQRNKNINKEKPKKNIRKWE